MHRAGKSSSLKRTALISRDALGHAQDNANRSNTPHRHCDHFFFNRGR